MQAFHELPNTLPIFPLSNAVVLPGGHLPLNIFEPRYLNMIEDAMQSHRLIGMIQPQDDNPNPKLYKVGCAARVTRYEETSDGRLEISLAGLCRFEIKDQLATTRGYQLVVPDWSQYNIDYKANNELDSITKFWFFNALRSHFKPENMEINWKIMEKLSTEKLFNTLFYLLEISDADKQLLIEMDTLEQRVKAIVGIFNNKSKESIVQH